MLGRRAADAVWQEGAVFRQLVQDEIQNIRSQRQPLLAQGMTGYGTILILVSCILGNLFLLLSLPDYIGIFIAASLYLHMVYFITLLLPIGGGRFCFPIGRIYPFFSTLYHTGIIPAADRFTRILLDAFFINSRTLFSGFLCIFSLTLLYTGMGYYKGIFSRTTAFIILFQVFVILLFYFLVWRFEPGTTRFWEDVSGMKGTLAGKRYPAWLIAFLFGTAALFVLLVILSTIILLPGVTVMAFLSLSGLEDLGNLFLLIGLVAASQYFIVRFFHGISSNRMAARFSESRILLLQAASGQRIPVTAETGSRDGAGPFPSGDALRSAAGALLESRIYRLELRTIWGAFPVYLVNLDFSVIFDEQVIAMITGYLTEAGSYDAGER